jgi:uncharacterized protein YeaO (DUF488 family)
MALFTKCIKAPKSASDGLRVSIMSRHTTDDGHTLDPDITFRSYDLHLRELGPPDSLVGPYLRKEITWEEYELRYLTHLRGTKVRGVLRSVMSMAKHADITLMCVEETPEYCHRRLLAEECQRIDPNYRVTVR